MGKKHEIARYLQFAHIALFCIAMLFGTVFRFYNLNWDQGHFFHPDERNIALAVTRIQFFSHLDPEFFAYGSLPIYVFRVTGDLLDTLLHTKLWSSEWGYINLIERFYSALFSTLTIYTIYRIGKKIASPTIGLCAMWFTAFTPLLIQQAHFGVTESIITFFGTLIVLVSYSLLSAPTIRNIVTAGIIYGLAMGTKASCIIYGVAPCAALLLSQTHKHKKTRALRIIFATSLLASIALVMYLAVSPYTILNFSKFRESMNYEGSVVWGKLIVVYVYQFLGTIPYLFQAQQLFYTQGVMLAILTILGLVYVAIFMFRPFNARWLVTFLWPSIHILIVGAWFTKFVRYVVPVYPFFSLAAALLTIKLLDQIHRKTAIIFGAGIFALSFFYALAQMHIYIAPQTRYTASQWIYTHIPQGSRVLTEHWDDGLPIPLDSGNPDMYSSSQLTIYEPDNEDKRRYYGEKLSKAQYIFINSRRLYGTLLRLTDRYPITSLYYKKLFDGSLGYKKVAEFSSYPQVTIGALRIQIPDDTSEESFQVYDHPKVLIFQNVSHFSSSRIISLLQ